jgi:hypothetical protein
MLYQKYFKKNNKKILFKCIFEQKYFKKQQLSHSLIHCPAAQHGFEYFFMEKKILGIVTMFS